MRQKVRKHNSRESYVTNSDTSSPKPNKSFVNIGRVKERFGMSLETPKGLELSQERENTLRGLRI
jgi:hypothetical protein